MAEGLSSSQRARVSRKWSVQVEEELCRGCRSKKEGVEEVNKGKNKGKT